MSIPQIIDFTDTSKKAFVRGFWKGFSAPVMLFGHFEAPEQLKINQISLPIKSDADALSGDWKAIGADFNKVIEKYGKEANNSK